MLHPGDPQASPCHGLEVKMSNCTLPLDRRFVTWVAETRGLVWRVQRHSLWKWANCPLICSMWIGDMIWLEIVDSSYPILRQTNIFHAMISTFLKRDGNLTNRNSESVLTVTICEWETCRCLLFLSESWLFMLYYIRHDYIFCISWMANPWIVVRDVLTGIHPIQRYSRKIV